MLHVITQGTVTLEAAIQETTTQGTITQETITQETLTQETTTQETLTLECLIPATTQMVYSTLNLPRFICSTNPPI